MSLNVNPLEGAARSLLVGRVIFAVRGSHARQLLAVCHKSAVSYLAAVVVGGYCCAGVPTDGKGAAVQVVVDRIRRC